MPYKAEWFLITIMILESAHLACPIVRAWSEPGLRAIVMREWREHIVLPILIMAGALAAPIEWVSGLFFAWNIHHFGMQNFGISSLWLRGDRELRGVVCLVVTALGMGLLPLLVQNDPAALLAVIVLFSFSHWLGDIGLSSWTARRRLVFVGAVMAFGVAWYALRQGPLSVHAVPQIIAIRYGIGMIHFRYSARIWKLSDPQIRAAMRRDLFAVS